MSIVPDSPEEQEAVAKVRELHRLNQLDFERIKGKLNGAARDLVQAFSRSTLINFLLASGVSEGSAKYLIDDKVIGKPSH